jgi:hypothetical protein
MRPYSGVESEAYMEVQGQPRTPPGGNMLSMRSATRLIAGRMRSPYNPPLPARLFRRAERHPDHTDDQTARHVADRWPGTGLSTGPVLIR